MTHLPFRPHGRWPAGLAFLLPILLAACQAQGIPGSFLLTPAYLRSPVVAATASATLEMPPEVEAPAETPTPPADTPTLEPVAATAGYSATPSPKPTETRTPTVTPTWDGTPSRTPTKTLVPTRTRRPTRTPSITPTPTPPLAFMRINKPGAYSKVSSPFNIEAIITAGADGLVHLQITGEDGRTIQRQDLDFRDFKERHLAIGPEIDFEIMAVSETARLSLYTLDEFDRISYLTSLDLVLIQIGDDDLMSSSPMQEPYIVRSPKPESVIKGGVVVIDGLAHLVNDRPLIVELLDEDNEVIARSELPISQPYGDLSHIPFNLLLTYQIDDPVSARLVFRQESATRILGTVFLSSVPIYLEP